MLQLHKDIILKERIEHSHLQLKFIASYTSDLGKLCALVRLAQLEKRDKACMIYISGL